MIGSLTDHIFDILIKTFAPLGSEVTSKGNFRTQAVLKQVYKII